MFMRLKDSVYTDMATIRNEMRELRTLYKRRRKILFNPDEIKDIDQQIGIHVQNIKGYFKGCEHVIREISSLPAGTAGQGAEGEKEALTVRKNIQRSLATELTKLSQEFRLAQKIFLQERKTAEQGGKEVFDIGDFEENPGEERLRQMETKMIEKGLSDEQIQEILLEEGILEERNQEIRAIVDSITDIHEMFRDLNQLVVEQGTLLDRIECNVESTAESMKSAVVELKKACLYLF